jgi:hypothetical protein
MRSESATPRTEAPSAPPLPRKADRQVSEHTIGPTKGAAILRTLASFPVADGSSS